MRSLALAAVSLLAACSPENLSAFQAPPRVNEIAHTVTTTFESGGARLRIRRTLQNGSDRFESLSHVFSMPEGAVATSLRLGSNGQWFSPGTLASTEDVEARWDQLISPGTAAPATLGKLEWSSAESLDFSAFGIPPGATLDVEYDVELPSTYRAGAVSFEYPLETAALGWLPPTFPGFEAQPLADDKLELKRAWATRDEADVRWATFPVDTDRTLWRLEVDVAAELGKLPKQAHVVFVVDASITEGEKGVDAQLELIAPFLANIPDAQVEVVVFRRFAERLFGRFVAAPDFARELSMLPRERLAVGNGSNLDEGAALALQTLAQEGGLGRVVLFTDSQVRHALDGAALAAVTRQAPRDVIVHVVNREEAWGESLRESRDDSSELSRAAEVTGGVAFRIEGHPGDPLMAADTLLALVRPVRIDSFFVEAVGLQGLAPKLEDAEGEEDEASFRGLNLDSEQYEGSAVRLSGLDVAPPQSVKVRGKIWARTFEREFTVDDALATRLPAYAVGDDSLRAELSDDELRTVAFVSGSVSPVTSYLAAPRDAAPSIIGLDVLPGAGGLSMYGIGCGGCSSSSRCGLRIGRTSVDLLGELRALLAPGVAACEAQLGPVTDAKLELEATADEVVDVRVSGVNEAMRGCLVEAGWAIRLSASFEHHRSYVLDL